MFIPADSPYYWIWHEGQQKKINTKIRVGTTVEQRADSRKLADELYHRLMLDAAAVSHDLTRPASERTLRDQIAWHQAHVTPHNRGVEREREILKRLDADLGRHTLAEITRPRVLQWARTRLAAGRAGSTVNREIDVLKAVLREAVPAYLKVSPLYGMTRLKSTTKPHRRLLKPAEEKKLLDALQPGDRAIVIMGLDTLCRFGDVLDLRRQDDHGKTLYIPAPKGGEPYEVPVSKRLRAALKTVPLNGPYYFEHRRQAKTERDRRKGFRLMLERLCKVLKIPYGRNHGGITFHTATRRTGATRMIQAGVDVRTVQEIGNWKRPDVLLAIYAESNAKARKKAVEAVGPQAKGRRSA